MELVREALELDCVRHAERAYRAEVVDDPTNTNARLGLAWCLFVQAVHAAGRESALNEILNSDGEARHRLPDLVLGIRNDSVGNLLTDCLKQTTAVMHLSRSAKERTDVELLEMLIGLAAAESWMQGTKQEAAKGLFEITKQIVRGIRPDHSTVGRTARKVHRTPMR